MEPRKNRSIVISPDDSERLRQREKKAPRPLKGSEAFRLAEAQMAKLAGYYPGARWAFQTIADITKG